MLRGEDPYEGRPAGLPMTRGHRQFAQGLAEYHLDAFPWIERLRGFDFSVGCRIHGNIAAILAGVPAHLLAHDSRTLELAQFFDIPVTRTVPERDSGITLEGIFEATDFTAFNENYASRFAVLSDFVHRCGFAHIHEPGREEDERAYMRRLYATRFPAPVRDLSAGTDTQRDLAAMWRMLKVTDGKQQRQINGLINRVRALGG